MFQSTVPPSLVSFFTSTQLSLDQASDALEEWISYRRSKGDTLFQVSVGLAELENRVRQTPFGDHGVNADHHARRLHRICLTPLIEPVI